MSQIVLLASVWVLPVLLAVTLHEAAHGWAAWRLGDPTAMQAGRVSFNPLRHIDPFGTVVLPAMLLFVQAPMLFGWAKPVPVDFRRLRNPRRDMILVAAAGPGINLLLAYAAALLLHVSPLLPDFATRWATLNMVHMLQLNILLAVFNMLPLPPLDGGRVAVGLLPARLALPLARLERFGMLIVLALFIVVPALGRSAGLDIDVFEWLVGGPVDALVNLVVLLAGHG